MAAATELRVMSFNIRFDNPNEQPQDKWDVRKETCAEIIKKYKPHVLGMQEPHKHQVEQMAALLPGYSWFGRGRHLAFMGINEEHNELNPVFYNSEALELEASGQWWYSDTPEIPNTRWSCSAFPRIATWGRFLVKGTNKRLCFINTHFDHESEEARTMAAEMLVAKAPEVSLGLPTIVVGDLNTGAGSACLEILCTSMLEASSCCDTCVLPGMMGKAGTFVGFDKSIDSQIDFIFGAQGAAPTAYGTVPDECPNGRCCSDHRPIMATLEIPDCPFSPEELAAKAAAAQGASAASAAASVAADKTKAVASRVASETSQVASKVAAETSVVASKVAVETSHVASRVAEEAKVLGAKAGVKASEAAVVAGEYAKEAAAIAGEKAKVLGAEAKQAANKAAEKIGNKLAGLFK